MKLETLDALPDAAAGDNFASAESTDAIARRRPGRVLTKLRALKGDSVEAIAEALGMKAARVAAFEADAERPQREEVIALADHLQSDRDVLLHVFGF